MYLDIQNWYKCTCFFPYELYPHLIIETSKNSKELSYLQTNEQL